MTIKDRLMADFKEAMKTKDEIAKNTISFARAAIKQYEVDNREELSDEGIMAVLSKQVKMRTDLADSYKAEIEILNRYLPEQLSEEEILKTVKETAAELGIEGGKQNMGKLMGPVMAKLKGRADGNSVKKVVTDFLG